MLRIGTDRQAGYSLLEVMVVLAIVALMVATVPAMIRDASPALKLRAASELIIGDLATARAKARTGGKAVAFIVDGSGRGYSFGGQSRELGEGVRVAFEADVTVGNSNANQFYFLPGGSSSGGRLSLTAGTHERQIEIDWLTSAIRVGSGS